MDSHNFISQLKVLTNYENGALVHVDDKNSIYISSDDYHHALNNDSVKIQKTTKLIDTQLLSLINTHIKDSQRIIYHGKIIEIISRNNIDPFNGILNIKSNTIYGMSKNGSRHYLFKPSDQRYPSFVVLSKINPIKYKRNIYITIKFLNWEKNEKYPRGCCETIIGEIGIFKNEIDYRLHVNNLSFNCIKKQIVSKEIAEKKNNN